MARARPAGDHLFLQSKVLGRRPSNTYDDRGYVTVEFEGVNQEDTVVVSYGSTALVKRRGYEE
ncbi:hypothetical protein [Halobellus ruber]|uniref:Uncharacterized protein n=1 Tax=Halobellus ruber TaxID=2761102 RepID=A0A7J9SJC9_9EURY|nr:hypothetical protein [Halobellus ruber]MBB6646219.1 hypothetical protein [Halobellus ruber]